MHRARIRISYMGDTVRTLIDRFCRHVDERWWPVRAVTAGVIAGVSAAVTAAVMTVRQQLRLTRVTAGGGLLMANGLMIRYLLKYE